MVILTVVVCLFIAIGILFVFCTSAQEQDETAWRIRDHGPPRVLDQIAEALHESNGKPSERVVATTLSLDQQFVVPLSPDRWRTLETRLGCRLPPLGRADKGWQLPEDWTGVADLAQVVAEQRPEWAAPPVDFTLRDWREAQIFVGVRRICSEQLCIPLEEIGRSDRFVEDLRAD